MQLRPILGDDVYYFPCTYFWCYLHKKKNNVASLLFTIFMWNNNNIFQDLTNRGIIEIYDSGYNAVFFHFFEPF